jgi:hypothetical protein
VPGATPARHGHVTLRQHRKVGSDATTSTTTRDLYFRTYHDSLLAHAAGGSNVWILYHDAYPDYDGFGVYYPADSSTVAVLEAHAAAMMSLNEPTDVSQDLTPLSAPVTSLGVPYPNPFNPSTAVRVEAAHPGTHASVVVYDLRGRLVRTLFAGVLGTGATVSWDGTRSDGRAVPSGSYFIRFERGSQIETRRVVLLR